MSWTVRNRRDQIAHGQNGGEKDERDGKKDTEAPYRSTKQGTKQNAKYESGVINFSLRFGTRNLQEVIADNVSCEAVITWSRIGDSRSQVFQVKRRKDIGGSVSPPTKLGPSLHDER